MRQGLAHALEHRNARAFGGPHEHTWPAPVLARLAAAATDAGRPELATVDALERALTQGLSAPSLEQRLDAVLPNLRRESSSFAADEPPASQPPRTGLGGMIWGTLENAFGQLMDTVPARTAASAPPCAAS